MARRATPVTKGRTAPKKTAASPPAASKPTRRGAKAMMPDEAAAEPAATDIALAGGESAHETDAVAPAKARRGRKPKPDAVMAADHENTAEAAPSEDVPAIEPEPPAVEAKAPKPPSSPRKTRRNREPEASAPPPLEMADEPAAEPHSAAAEWHAETGTVTFDWPAIEQVASAEGPNQPMAKLLLAARTAGATSRWPF